MTIQSLVQTARPGAYEYLPANDDNYHILVPTGHWNGHDDLGRGATVSLAYLSAAEYLVENDPEAVVRVKYPKAIPVKMMDAVFEIRMSTFSNYTLSDIKNTELLAWSSAARRILEDLTKGAR